MVRVQRRDVAAARRHGVLRGDVDRAVQRAADVRRRDRLPRRASDRVGEGGKALAAQPGHRRARHLGSAVAVERSNADGRIDVDESVFCWMDALDDRRRLRRRVLLGEREQRFSRVEAERGQIDEMVDVLRMQQRCLADDHAAVAVTDEHDRSVDRGERVGHALRVVRSVT